jgi:DNA modification methylase
MHLVRILPRFHPQKQGLILMVRWQNYASPVWMDIIPSDTLQKESAREDNDERHICPLQLQVIERGIELWTNPGDVVLSPFAGIGSEGYVAIKAGRRFVGVELKESYYKQAALNLLRAEREGTQDTLLDGLTA